MAPRALRLTAASVSSLPTPFRIPHSLLAFSPFYSPLPASSPSSPPEPALSPPPEHLQQTSSAPSLPIAAPAAGVRSRWRFLVSPRCGPSHSPPRAHSASLRISLPARSVSGGGNTGATRGAGVSRLNEDMRGRLCVSDVAATTVTTVVASRSVSVERAAGSCKETTAVKAPRSFDGAQGNAEMGRGNGDSVLSGVDSDSASRGPDMDAFDKRNNCGREREGGESQKQQKQKQQKQQRGVSRTKQKAAEKKQREELRKAVVLDSFSATYAQQFGAERWARLLAALKAPTRHCCLINRFADPIECQRVLQPALHSAMRVPFLSLPCLVLPRRDPPPSADNPKISADTSASRSASAAGTTTACAISAQDGRFPPPGKDFRGVATHYLLDAASVAVAEAVGARPGERVLDLCAAPGGKSVCMMQSMARVRGPNGGGDKGGGNGSGCGDGGESGMGEGIEGMMTWELHGWLVANEFSTPRRMRLRQVLKDYIPSVCMVEGDGVRTLGVDGTRWSELEAYDKVLVDAPCSSERHLLHDPQEMAAWTPRRSKHCAARQLLLLFAAAGAVREGGRLVYSTCSISDVENDKTIAKLLRKSKVPLRVEQRDWSIGERTKYGCMVLPDVSDGWGPIYMCSLRRVKPGEEEGASGESENEEDEIEEGSE